MTLIELNPWFGIDQPSRSDGAVIVQICLLPQVCAILAGSAIRWLELSYRRAAGAGAKSRRDSLATRARLTRAGFALSDNPGGGSGP